MGRPPNRGGGRAPRPSCGRRPPRRGRPGPSGGGPGVDEEGADGVDHRTGVVGHHHPAPMRSSSPSTAIDVATTGRPASRASRILRRVPPPLAGGPRPHAPGRGRDGHRQRYRIPRSTRMPRARHRRRRVPTDEQEAGVGPPPPGPAATPRAPTTSRRPRWAPTPWWPRTPPSAWRTPRAGPDGSGSRPFGHTITSRRPRGRRLRSRSLTTTTVSNGADRAPLHGGRAGASTRARTPAGHNARAGVAAHQDDSTLCRSRTRRAADTHATSAPSGGTPPGGGRREPLGRGPDHLGERGRARTGPR